VWALRKERFVPSKGLRAPCHPPTGKITGYGYDANGNVTGMPNPAPGNGYPDLYMLYDVFDRLTWYGNSGLDYGLAAVAYDAFGRRIAKYLPNGTTQIYFYDPSGRQVAQYNFDPNATCNESGTYVSCPTLNGPMATSTYFAGQRVGAWTDRVGSTRYTNTTNKPLGSNGAYSHYYPYGEEITSTNNDTFKFAQTYRDSDSGLDYAMNRFYASAVGRFLTVDRWGADLNRPQSWNRYTYTENDPANSSDPTGQVISCPNGDGCQSPDPDPGPDPGLPGGGGGGGCVQNRMACPPGDGGSDPPKKPTPGDLAIADWNARISALQGIICGAAASSNFDPALIAATMSEQTGGNATYFTSITVNGNNVLQQAGIFGMNVANDSINAEFVLTHPGANGDPTAAGGYLDAATVINWTLAQTLPTDHSGNAKTLAVQASNLASIIQGGSGTKAWTADVLARQSALSSLIQCPK